MRTNDVDSAAEALRSLFPATPLQLNEHLSQRYGANIWLKREDLTPVRSYKIRGAFNFFRKVIAAGGTDKVFVCASAGNHAQGFAFVCRHFGVQGVVFMPVTTPQQKIDKTRHLRRRIHHHQARRRLLRPMLSGGARTCENDRRGHGAAVRP